MADNLRNAVICPLCGRLAAIVEYKCALEADCEHVEWNCKKCHGRLLIETAQPSSWVEFARTHGIFYFPGNNKTALYEAERKRTCLERMLQKYGVAWRPKDSPKRERPRNKAQLEAMRQRGIEQRARAETRKQETLRMFHEGTRIEDIAEKLDMSRSGVRRILKKANAQK